MTDTDVKIQQVRVTSTGAAPPEKVLVEIKFDGFWYSGWLTRQWGL